jgi:hypothetical protein
MKPLDLAILREAIAVGRIQWRRHVLEKLAERGIQQQAVRDVLLNGEKDSGLHARSPLSERVVLGLYWRQTASCRGFVR